jgi:hypothetical protein
MKYIAVAGNFESQKRVETLYQAGRIVQTGVMMKRDPTCMSVISSMTTLIYLNPGLNQSNKRKDVTSAF